MKKHECRILTVLAALAASGIAAAGSVPAQTDPTQSAPTGDNPAAQAAETQAATPAPEERNRALTAGPAEEGLTLNLRGAPVDKVLKFLSESAGFTIIREANTQVAGTVDIVSDTPLQKADLVVLLNKVLARRGLAAIQDGRTLTIMSVQDAARFNLTPVQIWDHADASIPTDPQVVTEIISLHSLSATQVIKDLASLLPSDAEVNSNEGGNAIIMTARQSDLRRFTQIIQALDKSGDTGLEVFPLAYADSKAIAQELKDVFAAQDANAMRSNPFQNLPGGRAGGAPASAAAGSSGRTAIHVNAVSDEEDNAVLVSAPPDIMPGISNLIHKLDIQQDDLVQIRLFGLVHADPADVANEMGLLFPDAARQTAAQNNQRGTGAQYVGGQTAASSGAGLSERRKKQTTVIVVPDTRTKSLLVTASKDTMTQIATLIADLDYSAAGVPRVYVYCPQNADVADLQSPLSELFASSTRSSSGTLVNVLLQRANQGAQTSTTTTTSISSTGGSTGGK